MPRVPQRVIRKSSTEVTIPTSTWNDASVTARLAFLLHTTKQKHEEMMSQIGFPLDNLGYEERQHIRSLPLREWKAAQEVRGAEAKRLIEKSRFHVKVTAGAIESSED